MQQRSQERFASVQALRGIAALAVVLYHGWTNFDHRNTNLPAWLNEATVAHGISGVDLFFVISGFVIAWTAIVGRESQESPGEFFAKRLMRVVPVYWFATLIYIYFFANADGSQTIRSLLFYPLGGTDAPIYGVPALYVGWSLVYEMYFYVVFGVALLFGRWAIAVVATYFLAALLLLPLMTGQVFVGEPSHLYDYRHYYQLVATNPIILEFLMGIGVAYAYRFLGSRIGASTARVLAAASIAAVVISIVVGRANFSPLWHGLPMSLMLLSLLLAERDAMLKVPGWMAYLGEISYSIYLAHPFVIAFMLRVRTIPSGQWHLQVIEYVVALVLTIGLASVMYRYVEMPCMKAARALIARMKAAREQPMSGVPGRSATNLR